MAVEDVEEETLKEFVEWLESIDSYDVPISEVEEKFPKIKEEVSLMGATLALEDGEALVPKRDYLHKIKFGYLID